MEAEHNPVPPGTRVALVLGGGNALGAYHAGVYQALQEAGVEPNWIVGTSVGAVTGAMLAGNARDERLSRLRAFWQPERGASGWPMPWDVVPEDWRRTGAVIETMLAGRPGLFGPLGSTITARDAAADAPALYDSRPLHDTLVRMIDFDRLNSGAPRLTVAAVDVESGAEVMFDTQRDRIGPDHVRASASLLTTFPAVEVDGQLLGDGGLSMNLPLDPVMAEASDTPTLCIAVDLLPLAAPRPRTLGEVVARMQDLTFAAQSARTIARWTAVFAAERATDRTARSVTLVTAVYADQRAEVAGKAMDFSPASVRHRWDHGLADGRALIDGLRSGRVPVGRPGLHVCAARA
jgi:NTE family protein